jgi:hypothetical protein
MAEVDTTIRATMPEETPITAAVSLLFLSFKDGK